MSEKNPKFLAALGIGAALIIIAGVYLASGGKQGAQPEQAAKPAEPPAVAAAPAADAPAMASASDAGASPFAFHEAPVDLPATVFKDEAETELTLAKFGGKVMVVNFWATWCAPCVKEMPTLDRLQAKLGGADFEVLTISQDREGAKIAKPFAEKNEWKNLAFYVEAPGKFMRDAKLNGLPTSLIVDKSGQEVARVEGDLAWDSPEVEKIMRDLMAKN